MANAGDESLKVLGHWASPFVLRVTIALALKGVQYEYDHEDINNKSDLLLKSNPVHKKIPVLLHNSKSVCESLVVLEYIDETWSPNSTKHRNLLPQDPYLRCRSRFWAAFIDDKLGRPFRASYRAQGDEREKAKKEVKYCISLLEEALDKEFGVAGGPFFGGQELGFLDVALGSRAVWFRVVEEIAEMKIFDSEQVPLLSNWFHNFVSCDLVAKLLPDQQKLFEYAKSLQRYYLST